MKTVYQSGTLITQFAWYELRLYKWWRFPVEAIDYYRRMKCLIPYGWDVRLRFSLEHAFRRCWWMMRHEPEYPTRNEVHKFLRDALTMRLP